MVKKKDFSLIVATSLFIGMVGSCTTNLPTQDLSTSIQSNKLLSNHFKPNIIPAEQALANFLGSQPTKKVAEETPYAGTLDSLKISRAMLKRAKSSHGLSPMEYYKQNFNTYDGKVLKTKDGRKIKATGFTTKGMGGPDDKVYGAGYDLSGGGNNVIYQMDPATGDVTSLSPTYNNIYTASVAKHPLSGKVYYSNSNTPYQLYAYDFNNGQNQLIGNLPFRIHPRMAFSPAGKLYATRDNGGGNYSLYEIDPVTAGTTQINLSGWPSNRTGGDFAFAQDGTFLMIGSDRLYDVDIPGGNVTYLANLNSRFTASGSTAEAVASTTFDDQGRFLVGTYRYSGGNQDSFLYNLNLSNYNATLIKHYNNQPNTISDMTSSHYTTGGCPDTSAQAPTVPTKIMDENFAGMPANFANLFGEASPDLTTGWQQWNGDYYGTASGVVLWNPGPGNGIRSMPGEYEATRPDLLETAIYKDIPVPHNSGDTLIAKMDVAPTFNHAHSDATLVVVFNDAASTMAVSNSVVGDGAVSSDLFLETPIPDCATQARVIGYTYLGTGETSSSQFESVEVTQIPANHFTDTVLYSDGFDSSTTHPTFGTNFPANMDDQFSGYDFYTVDYPSAANKSVTVAKAGSSDTIGGLVKTINLGSYTPGSQITGQLFTSTTFSDPTSEASFYIEFYDAGDNQLGVSNAQKISGSQYRYLNVDHADIPAGATYIKFVPVVKLGASETSAMLWDDMKVIIHQP